MRILRTPEERFQALAEFPFAPHYLEIDSGAGPALRIHYLDQGPRDGEIVLCMHGQPTSSHVYGQMIPHLTAAAAPGFFYWIRFAAEQPDFRVSELTQVTALHALAPAQYAAYEAPFPDDHYMTGARAQRHATIERAGHFLQEDQPEAFARVVIEFMRANPRPH